LWTSWPAVVSGGNSCFTIIEGSFWKLNRIATLQTHISPIGGLAISNLLVVKIWYGKGFAVIVKVFWEEDISSPSHSQGPGE
jgi:hypothetical protein